MPKGGEGLIVDLEVHSIASRSPDVVAGNVSRVENVMSITRDRAGEVLIEADNLKLRGDYAEARKRLLDEIKIDPQNPLFYRALGLVNLESGQGREAVTNFDEAAQLAEQRGDLKMRYECLVHAARVCAFLHNHEQAKEYLFIVYKQSVDYRSKIIRDAVFAPYISYLMAATGE